MPEFSVFRRIYYDDTDSGGVVYHANYFRYMEHARSDYLQARGLGPTVLADEHGVLFAVTDLSAKYIAPARLGDEIEIVAELEECSSVKLKFAHTVWLLGDNRKRENILTKSGATVVCLDAERFSVTKIPKTVRERIIRDN